MILANAVQGWFFHAHVITLACQRLRSIELRPLRSIRLAGLANFLKIASVSFARHMRECCVPTDMNLYE